MKKIILIVTSCLLIISFIITSVLFITPSPILAKPNYIEIYDQNDTLIYSELNQTESKYIDLENLPPYVYQAFIAIEDKNFYSHNGFDISRNIQAFFINLFSLSIKQGASTITQQYARNIFLSNERTLLRKIKEAFYTIKLEKKYTKNDILEGYLNSLYLGHGINGIEAASEYYFAKSAYNLTLAEASLLAAICNAPTLYSPNINPSKAKYRQELVLYHMLIQNYISKEDYQSALKEIIDYSFIKKEPTNFNYYKDGIFDELKKLNIYTKDNFYKGLKIYTSIDFALNKKIDELLKIYKPSDKDTQTSIVIMEPFSSNILYLSGGFDYNESSYNRATHSNRQIGSTIKPLLYYLALANGFAPNTLLTSEETVFHIENIGEYSPKNPNNKYANKEIDMIQATALSDNIYALKTLLLLGSKNLVNLLSKFSITIDNALPSIALGSLSTSLLKLTSIYNTFASLGSFYKPRFISKVTDYNDNLIYLAKNNEKTILDNTDSLILTQLLTATFDSSISSYLNATLANYKPYNIYAGKSGTTKNDSYVLAYNPNYTIGIWVGSDSNEKLVNHTLSKQLFKEITSILDTGKNPTWYAPSSLVKPLRYNPNTHEFSDTGSLYYFKNK